MAIAIVLAGALPGLAGAAGPGHGERGHSGPEHGGPGHGQATEAAAARDSGGPGAKAPGEAGPPHGKAADAPSPHAGGPPSPPGNAPPPSDPPAGPGDVVTGADQNLALDAVRSGEALPLDEIIAKAGARWGGRVIDARLIRSGGRLIYRLTVVSDDGVSRHVHVDARTAQPVRIK